MVRVAVRVRVKSEKRSLQNALVYIPFCVARKNSVNLALGHDSISINQ